MNRTIAAALAALAITALTPVVASADTPDTPELCTVSDAYSREVGDDNCDGRIMEDESGWDCATMGNLICGPGVVRHENVQLSDVNAWDAGAYVGGWN